MIYYPYACDFICQDAVAPKYIDVKLQSELVHLMLYMYLDLQPQKLYVVHNLIQHSCPIRLQ